MTKKLLPLIFLHLLNIVAYSQGSLLPIGNPAYHTIDRLEVLNYQSSELHSAIKGYRRGDVVKYAVDAQSQMTDSAGVSFSRVGESNLQFIFQDNNEWLYLQNPDGEGSRIERSLSSPLYRKNDKPFLNVFYPTPANLLEVNEPNLHLRINPMLNLGLGVLENEDEPLYYNQRGLEI